MRELIRAESVGPVGVESGWAPAEDSELWEQMTAAVPVQAEPELSLGPVGVRVMRRQMAAAAAVLAVPGLSLALVAGQATRQQNQEEEAVRGAVGQQRGVASARAVPAKESEVGLTKAALAVLVEVQREGVIGTVAEGQPRGESVVPVGDR
jgi:hypothetical protein